MTEYERAVKRADAIAERFIGRAAPVRFTLAVSPREREAIYRLRARVVIERGWVDPGALRDGIERDQYDDRAVYIAGWDCDELVATARLVFPAPGAPLPVEEQFQVDADPHGRSANVDRIIVARDYSDPHHRLLSGVTGRCWLELRAQGYSAAVGVLSPTILRLYRRIGWRLESLGPARQYWGEQRIPYRFDPIVSLDPGAGEVTDLERNRSSRLLDHGGGIPHAGTNNSESH